MKNLLFVVLIALVLTAAADTNELTDRDKMFDAMNEQGISYLWIGSIIAVFANTNPVDVCKIASAYPAAGVDTVISAKNSTICTATK